MSAPALNGHLSAVESDPLDAKIDQLEADLEAMLAPLRERRAELEVELMELGAKEERIGNALRALEGRAPVGGAPARTRARTPRASRAAEWTPSGDVVERVHAALKAHKEPVSTTDLAEQVGVSRDTVHRSLKILRSEDKARLVGTSGRGNAHVFLAMEP
jgi:hypothetical protein